MRQRVVDMVQNGIGTFVSRVMIIAGFPAITALCVFGFNQWSEKMDLKIQYIIEQTHDLNETSHSTLDRVNRLEGQMGRVDERLSSQDARISQLEKRR